MREETRYRVTGSLFLLALAVICLPMLFDGAGLPARTLPDLPMNQPLPEPEPLPARPPESDFVARVAELRERVDEQGFLTDSGTRFGEPVLTPADTGRAADAEAPAGEAEPARRSQRAAGGAAWAVQVASFARAANAEQFRARLRADGYEAFISTVKSDDRVLSRVAVGPFLDRERARTLQQELSARYDVQARLMAFSN
ncbi:MAG TPA: SPOR domain-containing protein [Pseudomonadales bacterium]